MARHTWSEVIEAMIFDQAFRRSMERDPRSVLIRLGLIESVSGETDARTAPYPGVERDAARRRQPPAPPKLVPVH